MDSFMEKMAVYLNHTFGKTIYCHYKDVDGRIMKYLIEKYRPDFVIYQMVERSLELKESHLTAGNLIQYASDVKTIAQFDGIDLHQYTKKFNAICVQSQNREAFSFQATSSDPYFTLPPAKLPKDSYLCLELKIVSPADTILELFYQTQGTYNYSQAQSVKQRLTKGPNNIRLLIPEMGIRGNKIRIDPGTMPGVSNFLNLTYVYSAMRYPQQTLVQ